MPLSLQKYTNCTYVRQTLFKNRHCDRFVYTFTEQGTLAVRGKCNISINTIVAYKQYFLMLYYNLYTI